jgi:hypothetical protein
MAQKENTLTTALQAAQARQSTVTVNVNPAALSAHLTQGPVEPMPQIDFQEQLRVATHALQSAVETYLEKKGTPNLPLIDARNEVTRLTAELEAAKIKLASIEAKGTHLDQLNAAVIASERSVTFVIDRFSRYVTEDLMFSKFGRLVAFQALSPASKDEIKFHARLHDLLGFRVFGDNRTDEASVLRRADAVYEKLESLASHIAKDQKHNAKS